VGYAEFQRCRATHAVTEDVRAVDAEVIQQAGDVAGERRRGDLPVDVRGTAVTLHLHPDQLVCASQGRDERGEVEIDSQHAAVQQDQW
jgi:hypothetical protein